MKKLIAVLLLVGFSACAQTERVKIGIVGLVHGHVAAFLGGGQKTNVTVTEILDAARQSAQTGRKIDLPLAR